METVLRFLATAAAPVTYIGLLVYSFMLTIHDPDKEEWTRDDVDITKYNLRIWGYGSGIIIFMIMIVLQQLGYITINALDIMEARPIVFALFGFLLGVLLTEGARQTKEEVFQALLIMLVVAGSLGSLYVFIYSAEIRTALVLATMTFLLGIMLDFIARNGIRGMEGGDSVHDDDDGPDWQ